MDLLKFVVVIQFILMIALSVWIILLTTYVAENREGIRVNNIWRQDFEIRLRNVEQMLCVDKSPEEIAKEAADLKEKYPAGNYPWLKPLQDELNRRSERKETK